MHVHAIVTATMLSKSDNRRGTQSTSGDEAKLEGRRL